MKIKRCTSCGHHMTTENSKNIGEQKLPEHPDYVGKKMALYNCPKCDSTVAHITDTMEKAIPAVSTIKPAKEAPTLNYADMNKIKKPSTEPKTIDYSSKEMKRDPKKDPNWKQAADKAKLANQTKNNPNIVKGINNEHYVVPKVLGKSDDLEKGPITRKTPMTDNHKQKIANDFAGGTFDSVLQEGPGYRLVSNYKHNGLSHGSPTPVQSFDTSKGSGQFGNGLYLAHSDDIAKFHAQGMRQGNSGQRAKGEGFTYKGSFHAPRAVLVHDPDQFGSVMTDDDDVEAARDRVGDHMHPTVTKHWGNAAREMFGAHALVHAPSETGADTPFTQTLAMHGSKFTQKKPKMQKSALPSSPYNNEVEAKIAKIKDKYAPKGPLTMEDKVKNLKDRYHKLDKPEELAPGADTNSTEDLHQRHKIQKLHSRHRALKSV